MTILSVSYTGNTDLPVTFPCYLMQLFKTLSREVVVAIVVVCHAVANMRKPTANTRLFSKHCEKELFSKRWKKEPLRERERKHATFDNIQDLSLLLQNQHYKIAISSSWFLTHSNR